MPFTPASAIQPWVLVWLIVDLMKIMVEVQKNFIFAFFFLNCCIIFLIKKMTEGFGWLWMYTRLLYFSDQLYQICYIWMNWCLGWVVYYLIFGLVKMLSQFFLVLKSFFWVTMQGGSQFPNITNKVKNNKWEPCISKRYFFTQHQCLFLIRTYLRIGTNSVSQLSVSQIVIQ